MTERDAQKVTRDDFEKSLLDDGLEVVYPREETDEDTLGAGGFPPRLTAPVGTNPYYLKYGEGGYNCCIAIDGNSCLPNGVGYAHGRFLEIGGATNNNRLPTCDAIDWPETAEKNGLLTGPEPKRGAAIVWKCDDPKDGNSYGHIGVVEAIAFDGTLTVSQSSYGGSRFYISKHKPPYNVKGYSFVTFIYNPYIASGTWVKNDADWWYQNTDGSYPTDQWLMVNDRWYHFDSNGIMQTGWLTLENGRVYLGADGAAVSGWKFINAKWYYFDKDCFMKTGWVKVRDKWYYLQEDGVRLSSSWLKHNGDWCYVGRDGAVVTGRHTIAAFFDKEGRFIGNPQ